MRVLVLLLTLLPAAAALAQGDLASERKSLDGVAPFAADLTVEAPQHLAESDILHAEALLHRIVNRMRDAGVSVDRQTSDDADRAFLHIHLHLMELDRGLVPFSISADFYQRARLAGSGFEMAAVTWDESVLGLVSRDLLATIPESVDSLVDQFVADYKTANTRFLEDG